MLMELEYLVRNPEQPLRSDLGFGINLIVETGKAFHWKRDTFNNTDCRIKALALAGEVLESVSEVCKLDEDDIVATAHASSELMDLTHNLRDLLKTYRSLRRFGFYHQSPWVGGGDMAAAMGNAQLLGLKLLQHQGVFGCFLHLYHMLAHLSAIKRI